MRELFFVLGFGSLLSAQLAPPTVYLVRLDHSNHESHACTLLQASGDFHLEVDAGDATRVFEGQLNPTQLESLERSLSDSTLENLSQRKIEEPLISNRRDSLEISIFRNDHWQELRFETAESQAPFAKSLAPLLRWLAKLEKLPHRELSEDAGKNNCLPPKKLALKRRPPALPETPPKTQGLVRAPMAVPSATAPDRAPVSILFGMFSFRMAQGGAHQSCMLIADDGQYRFEERVQSTATKPVRTQGSLGRLSAEEISQLRQILDSPNLVNIRHHEPAGGLVVRMLRDMVRLSIRRTSGVQEIVLSSNQHSSGYFYSGDADLGRARDLFEFLSEHVESKGSGNLDPSLRNDCKQLP
jgi:hypothetical protein